MNNNFSPLLDRVLVDPTPVEEKTEGGIIIPGNASNTTPTVGTVLAIGPGRTENGTLIAMNVCVGDRVTWSKFAGTHIEIRGCDLLLMRETDIAGILT